MDKSQKALIKQWIGVSRYVFNQTIAYLKQPDTKANWKAIKGDILNALPEFCKAVPYQIKSIAVKDACTAVSNAKKKFKKTGQVQDVRFRSRKNPVQSCYIPKSAVSEKGIYVNAAKNILAAGLAVSVCGAGVRPEESKSRKAPAMKQKPKS